VLRRFRPRLSYANVMVTILVFVVLGGGAYAAFHLPKNSVRSKNIVNGQVKGADLGRAAVSKKNLAKALTNPPFHSAGLPNDANLDCSSVTDAWASQDSVSKVGYYRDFEGRVYLQGIAARCGTPSSTNTIFVLPKGFRPSQYQAFANLRTSNENPTGVTVQSNGLVIAVSTNPGEQFSLSGVSFRCGPSGKNGCP
jgi:hypothetical protein